MKVEALSHVALTVSDFDKSRKFYGDLLGFEIKDINYEGESVAAGFYFLVGSVSIWFLKHKAMPANDRFTETRLGLDHLSFKATNEADLKAMADKLLAAGVDTKGMETYVTGNKYIAFRDPDNIQLEYWLD